MRPLLLFSTSAFLSSPSLFISRHISLLSFSFSSSFYSTTANSTPIEPKPVNILTQEDLTKINLLIPRLCQSNHLLEAIRLIDVALLTNPPLKCLSLSILIHCLASQPDMTQSMSLLTRLKHNSNAHPSLLPITTMLISSYIKKSKPKEAFKVFNWMLRPNSPSPANEAVYGILISGFCRNGLVFEALKVFREMVAANFVPGSKLRQCVYRSLLREARVREAKELNEDLSSIGVGGCEALKKVVEFLDEVIANWTD